jgi:hypothetical protein
MSELRQRKKPIKADAEPEPEPRKEKVEVITKVSDREVWMYLFRAVLIFALFVCMQRAFWTYVFEPIFHPHTQVDPEAMRRNIMERVCPPGAETCSFAE